VLALDEEDADDDDLTNRARVLLKPPKQSTPFGRRYLSLMQREPALVIAHSALAKRL
jgi:hypothetical protein